MTENLHTEVDYSILDKFNINDVELIEPINWNEVKDPKDKEIWEKLTQNFWLDTKVALSNDIASWNTFTTEEQAATVKVFMGLTLLDTVQSAIGAVNLIPDARTQHEEAVYTNIAFMESVHAKSYSSIFSTLISSSEIKEAFRWAKEDEYLKRKQAIVLHYYRGNDPEKRKIASTMLESFLFYSGFFMPLWWATKGKLTNTADIIRLIIRDESIHGYFIGYKFQQAFKESSPERRKELEDFTHELMYALYANEEKYTESLYDEIGLTEEVKKFLKYNANKALNNLGFEAVYSAEETQVAPQILASLNPGSDENHDFFSGSGSSYVIANTEETDDDDWDF